MDIMLTFIILAGHGYFRLPAATSSALEYSLTKLVCDVWQDIL